MDFSEGIEFRYSRWIWCLRQPFFSHVIDKGVFIFKVWDRVTFLISVSLSWICHINLAASYKLSIKPSKAIYKSWASVTVFGISSPSSSIIISANSLK